MNNAHLHTHTYATLYMYVYVHKLINLHLTHFKHLQIKVHNKSTQTLKKINANCATHYRYNFSVFII